MVPRERDLYASTSTNMIGSILGWDTLIKRFLDRNNYPNYSNHFIISCSLLSDQFALRAKIS